MNAFNIQHIISQAKSIDDEEFEEIYVNAWTNMLSFKKFETLQTYNVDEDSYVFFKEKKYNKFVNELKSFYDFYKQEFALNKNNASIQRLRYVEFPISLYIQHEYYSYIISDILGEEIKYISESNSISNIKDFILFDKNILLINLFDENGVFVKTMYYEDKSGDTLDEVYQDFEILFSTAKDFKEIMNPNANIINLINQNIK